MPEKSTQDVQITEKEKHKMLYISGMKTRLSPRAGEKRRGKLYVDREIRFLYNNHYAVYTMAYHVSTAAEGLRPLLSSMDGGMSSAAR